MHGLVQLSTRRWLEAIRQQEAFRQQCIERLAVSFPTGDYENWPKCQSLFAHVQLALGYRPSDDMVEKWATLAYNGGWYAWLQGNSDVAEQILSRAKKLGEEVGKEDMATLASTSMLARIFRDMGRWKAAEKLFVQVMETQKVKLGADHPKR